MKVKDQKTVRIDPNRKHTLAEVRLVMDVYGCDETRARAILKIRLSPQRREEIRGMVDAILVEQAIAMWVNGRSAIAKTTHLVI